MYNDAAIIPFSLLNTTVADGTLTMDADTEMLAWKYFPPTTAEITDVDLHLNEVGDCSGINFQIEIQTDNADAPSGTTVGAATPSFAFTADGFTGLQTLATPTGALTLNTPVWIVLKKGAGGSSLSGTNNVTVKGTTDTALSFAPQIRARHHNGTNWTTTSVGITRSSFVVQHSGPLLYGTPFTAAVSITATAADIFDSNKQGGKFRYGAKVAVSGCIIHAVKTGSPTNLKVRLFQGSVEKASATIAAASIVTKMPVYFSAAIEIPANTDFYLVLNQVGTDETDGGDNSNDYYVFTYKFAAAYANVARPSTWSFVYGTSTDPTALTTDNTQMPAILPFVSNPVTSITGSTGGGSFAFIQ